MNQRDKKGDTEDAESVSSLTCREIKHKHFVLKQIYLRLGSNPTWTVFPFSQPTADCLIVVVFIVKNELNHVFLQWEHPRNV